MSSNVCFDQFNNIKTFITVVYPRRNLKKNYFN